MSSFVMSFADRLGLGLAGSGMALRSLFLVLLATGLVALAVSAYYAATFVAVLVRRKRVLKAMPKAPGWMPLMGHVFSLLHGHPWTVFKHWTLKHNGGPVHVQVFHQDVVAIADPELLKRVLQTHMKVYVKDIEFSYKPFLSILGTGLVTADGELWRKQRALVSTAFRIEILDDIIAIAKRAVDRLSVKLEAHRGTGRPVEMSEEFRKLTLQVIGEALLSLPPEESDRVLPSLYLPIMEESNRRSLQPWRQYLPTPSWFLYRSRVAQLDAYIIDLLRARWDKMHAPGVPGGSKGAGGMQDVVDRVLASLSASEWGPAAQRQLCFEVKTFLLAGHETSAAMLTWSLYETTQSEAVRGRLVAEAAAAFAGDVCGAAEPLPRREHLESTTRYSLGALKEALRKYSVVPVVTRQTACDDELAGYPVPAGTVIVLSLQGVHHRPDLWPEPFAYKPERFLTPAEGGPPEWDPYNFVSFIQGPRNCLGQHLALLEARVVLGLLVKRFRFRSASADNEKLCPKMIPLGPADGMWLTVE